MTRLTQMIIGTREDIHVATNPKAPHAFFITLGDNHQPVIESSFEFDSPCKALDSGWALVKWCKEETAK